MQFSDTRLARGVGTSGGVKLFPNEKLRYNTQVQDPDPDPDPTASAEQQASRGV